MEFASTVDFAQAARQLGRAARRLGLEAPGYRCPPRIVGVDRTIRRRPRGAVVAVRVKGRPKAAVLADMIEGIVVANRLQPPQADRVRTELWGVADGGHDSDLQPRELVTDRSFTMPSGGHVGRGAA